MSMPWSSGYYATRFPLPPKMSKKAKGRAQQKRKKRKKS